MIFQSAKTTITKLLQGKHAPFLTIVHYVIHIWTKLVVQILNSLCFTTKIEALLAFVYNYYVHSPKQALEQSKLNCKRQG
jgi:hypothetical protein